MSSHVNDLYGDEEVEEGSSLYWLVRQVVFMNEDFMILVFVFVKRLHENGEGGLWLVIFLHIKTN